MSHSHKGFTLIELMVVMVIISILGTIGILSFRTSQLKARDTKRKSDLQMITRGLEAYYNDFGQYPLSDANGNILGCLDVGAACLWGQPFSGTETTYITTLPKDPVSAWNYVYEYLGREGYRLYARLENTEDSTRVANGYGTVCDPSAIGAEQYCNHVLLSAVASDPIQLSAPAPTSALPSTTTIPTGSQGIALTGGTVTDAGGYRIHTFTSSGTLVVSTGGSRNVEVLVVAGGGGSGGGGDTGYFSGAGGGGGVVYNAAFSVSPQSYSVIVGNGGPAGIQIGDHGYVGGNGADSVFSTITAVGGGGGGGGNDNNIYNPNGKAGGSGGGGAIYSGTGGGRTVNQGYIGGSASADYGAGGGGGGAGSAGGNGASDTGGAAGNGVSYSISGAAVYYGGGGAARGQSSSGSAGSAGGTAADTAGTQNRGAGGGAVNGTAGRAGGTGVVIIRYPYTP